MKECTSCGQSNPTDARYCAQCGQEFPANPFRTMGRRAGRLGDTGLAGLVALSVTAAAILAGYVALKLARIL